MSIGPRLLLIALGALAGIVAGAHVAGPAGALVGWLAGVAAGAIAPPYVDDDE